MIEVAAAIQGATFAFNALKKGITIGKDLESMSADLSRWAGAMSDLDFCEKQNNKPSVFQILGGGVEQQAMEIFAAKKQRDSMKLELKNYICAVYGPSHYEELLRIEAEIRIQKRENEYARYEMIQSIKEWAAGITLFVVLCAGMFGFIWLAVYAK
tara:strand:+ start:315 stop:782 length:468 start_codon:yes stop_codon:yes gene_type:complete